MKKKINHKESRGLPGGPNEQFTYVTGVFSTEGYKRNSPDVNNPFNIIPSGNITMQGVDFPVLGIDNLGNKQMMMPGREYTFPGDYVIELPQMGKGGLTQMQNGGDREGLKTMRDAYSYTQNYYNSPKFKERFVNAQLDVYGNSVAGKNIVNRNFDNALSGINNNLKSGQYYLLQGQNSQPLLDQLLRIVRGRPNPSRFGHGSHFDELTNTTFVFKDQLDENKERLGVSFIAPHEFSHQAVSGINTIPFKQAKEIESMQLKKDLHLNNPYETKADIDAFRYYLYKNNIYNPMTEDFTEQHLEKYKKRDNKVYRRLNELYRDSDLIKLMNTVAKDSTINNDQNYVKYGGQIKNYHRYQTGGLVTINEGDGVRNVISTNSPQYRKAYKEGRLGVKYDDFIDMGELREAVVTPYSPNLARDIMGVFDSGIKTAGELTGLAGTARFIDDPVENLKNAARFFGKTLVKGSPYTGSSVYGNVDLNTQVQYTPEELEGFFNTLDASGIAGAILAPAKAPLQAGLKQAAKYATTKTPLRNAWQYNPFAPKLGKYNRVVGQDAVEDMATSGLVRVNQNAGVAKDLGSFGVQMRTTPYPSFGAAQPQQNYINQVISQGKTPYVISTDRPMRVSTLGRHGKGSTQFPINAEGKYISGFPASEAKVYEAAPHWLRGYKPVNVSKSNFKSEIDWSKWNEELNNHIIPYTPSIANSQDAFNYLDAFARNKKLGTTKKQHLIDNIPLQDKIAMQNVEGDIIRRVNTLNGLEVVDNKLFKLNAGSNKKSLHFTHGAPVQSHLQGAWDAAPTTYIMPAKDFGSLNGMPRAVASGDTYWYNPRQFEFPKSLKVYTGDMEHAATLRNAGYDVTFDKESFKLNKKIKALQANPKAAQYGTPEYNELTSLSKQQAALHNAWVKAQNPKPIDVYDTKNIKLGTLEPDTYDSFDDLRSARNKTADAPYIHSETPEKKEWNNLILKDYKSKDADFILQQAKQNRNDYNAAIGTTSEEHWKKAIAPKTNKTLSHVDKMQLAREIMATDIKDLLKLKQAIEINPYTNISDNFRLDLINNRLQTGTNLYRYQTGGKVMIDDGDIKKVISTNSPQYRRAYKEGRLGVKYDDFIDMGSLPEITVGVNKKTGRNILEDYPYFNQLTEEEKKYFTSNGPVGRQVRSKATNGVGVTADGVRDFAMTWLRDLPYEYSGLAGTVRFINDPVQNLKNAGNFLGKTLVKGSPYAGSSPYGNINLNTQVQYTPEEIESFVNTLDAAGMASMAVAPFKAPVQAGLRQGGKYLIEETAINTLPKAKNFREVLGTLKGIPTERSLARLSPEQLKTFRQVQEIGRMRAKKKPLSEQYRYALDQNIPDEDFIKIFGKSKAEINPNLVEPEIDVFNLLIPDDYQSSRYNIRDRFNLERRPGRRDAATYNEVFNRLNEAYDLAYQNTLPLQDIISNHPAPPANLFIPEDLFLSRFNNFVTKRRIPQSLVKSTNDKLEDIISNYPVYRGQVKQNVPSLSLRSSGTLKNVSKEVRDNSTSGISSGDVFTGSLNTSHSSYLPQLKELFKYTEGTPQFLGYKPMNSLGFLSEFNYSADNIAKYLNTEIDKQIKRGIIPSNIQRPYVKKNTVLLPHYGIKQFQTGGEYKVKAGDTFYGIANRNNISWEDLKKANPDINIENLKINQVIKLPRLNTPKIEIPSWASLENISPVSLQDNTFFVKPFVNDVPMFQTETKPKEKPEEKQVPSRYEKLKEQYLKDLKIQENSVKKGWNEEKQLWFPYKAVEKDGGYDIGFGHKILRGEDFSKGLTQEEVITLMLKDYKNKRKSAESFYNRKGFDRKWEDLDPTEQILLTDYQYNAGLNKFPKFLKAVANKDKNTMLKEYIRYSDGKPLVERNKWTKSFIENTLNYQKGGDVSLIKAQEGKGFVPIYVDNPNDPRIRSYQDSLNLYKAMVMQDKLMGPNPNNANKKYAPSISFWTQSELKKARTPKWNASLEMNIAEDFPNEKDMFAKPGPWGRPEDKKLLDYYRSLGFGDDNIMFHSSPDIVHPTIRAVGSYHDGTAWSPVYKKPIQPIQYANPEIVKKQKLLKEAGLYEGNLDGLWGPKSQAAWDEYTKQKEVKQPQIVENKPPIQTIIPRQKPQREYDNSNKPFVFLLGNAAYATYDEATAKDFARDLGIENPQRGNNKNIDPNTGLYREYNKATPNKYSQKLKPLENGGELNVYQDYINGMYDGTSGELQAQKIYDKLNRVYYRNAKELGMTPPNYIMSKVITS